MGSDGSTRRRMDGPCAEGLSDPRLSADERPKESPMPGLLPDVDPDGLLEFSVVYIYR